MQQANVKTRRSLIFYLVSSLFTGIVSFVFFVLLGTFYIAKDHSILVNIIVWFFTGLVAYLVFYFVYLLFLLLFKKSKDRRPFLNGYAVSAAYVSVLIACLALSKNVDDYSYVTVFSLLGSVPALIQIIWAFNAEQKPKRKRTEPKK